MSNNRLREKIYLLQGSKCFYCGNAIVVAERVLNPIVSNAGKTSDDNVVVVCEALNSLLEGVTTKQKLIMIKAGGGKIQCPQKELIIKSLPYLND